MFTRCRGLVVAGALIISSCPRDPSIEVLRDSEADAMQERGRKLLDDNDLEPARVELTGALRRHQAVGDHLAASRDASLLSQLHQKVDGYREALHLAALARAEAYLSGDAAASATALVDLGTTLYRLGDSTRAIAAYDEALPQLPESDKVGRARVGIYRALALHAQGRSPEAAKLLYEARATAQAAGNHGLVLAACVNLADIALTEGRLDDAERHLRHARAASEARGDKRPSTGILLNESHLARLRGDLPAAAAALALLPENASRETEWYIDYRRGTIDEAAGKLDEAERHYRAAVDIVERLRRKFAPEDARAPFLEKRWAPFESLFALQLRRDDARGAFATLAQAQGRMFLDTLLASLAEAGPATSSRIDGAIGRIDALERVIPPLADAGLEASASLDATLAALRGLHVLAYFPAAGRLRLLLVVDGEPRTTEVDVALDELDKLIDEFRIRPDDQGAAERLGRALVPAEALSGLAARFHIIPTGPLMRVPFAALVVAGQRLVERHEIVYAPSVTGLAAMARDSTEDGGGPGRAVVLADARRDLHHAADELAAILERTAATPYVGSEATVAAFRAAADSRLLHVISHSGVGSEGGYLLLADGKVTATDLIAWRVRPRLAVLPTCASAATWRGEMWDSLAAALLAAGSRHVVATIASVQDPIATEFTRHFYREDGLRDPIGATTRAQRQMVRHHSVAAWSAFVVAGR